MSNLVIRPEEYEKDIEMFKSLIQVAMKSGAYQLNETQMLNVMLSARDLGVSPMKAINGGFNVISGKISMSTSLMTDRIRREGHSIQIPEWTSKKCVVMGKRRDNGDQVIFEFTMEDAALAGLINSSTWKKYPKAMLYNRAMAQLARVLFPDVVGNCYSEDEGEEIGLSSNKLPAPMQIRAEIKEDIVIEEIDISIEEASELVSKTLQLESEKEKIAEYILHCKQATKQPLKAWISKIPENPYNQDRFRECFEKWKLKNVA